MTLFSFSLLELGAVLPPGGSSAFPLSRRMENLLETQLTLGAWCRELPWSLLFIKKILELDFDMPA